jgi:indolepyruvate decarboxylase
MRKSLVRPALLADPQTAADEIVRVVAAVRAQCRPGYLEIPYDVVDLAIQSGGAAKRIRRRNRDAENLAAAVCRSRGRVHRLRQAAGHHRGYRTAASRPDRRRRWPWPRRSNIPVAATLFSKSIIGETNPLYIGVYSGGLSEPSCQQYVEGSDCVILLGAFLSDVFMGMKTARLDRRKTILANTEKLRIGLHAYEDVLLKDFLDGLRREKISP